MLRIQTVTCLIIVAILLAACGGDDDDDTAVEDARSQLCAELGVLNNEVAVLKSLTGADYVAELRDSVADIRAAEEAVRQAAEDYDEAVDDDIQEAADALEEATDSIPTGATSEEASAEIADELAALDEAQAQAIAELDCSTTASASPTGNATADTTTPTAEPSPTLPATVEPTATTMPPTQTPEPTATLAPTATLEPSPTPTESPTPTPPPTVPPTPEGTQWSEAYVADWSAGAGNWVLPQGWLIENNALILEADASGHALAPYQPAAAAYAVEVQMAATFGQEPPTCDNGGGILLSPSADVTVTGTVPTGVLFSRCHQGWELSVVDTEGQRETLIAGQMPADDAPHTFRVEVSQNTVRILIDGTTISGIVDERIGQVPFPGLYSTANYRITVSTFRVFELAS
jgi:hypothetical protein